MEDTIKDPVCGMPVSRDAYALDYQGIHYAFCSQQCQDRFRANPHLYIGVPGEKSAKQTGVEILKRRRFSLEQPMSGAGASLLKEELGRMMGIKDIEVAGDTVAITYDLVEATAEQIEACIIALGPRLGSGWAARLQRGFVHYIEECEVGSLEVSPNPRHH